MTSLQCRILTIVREAQKLTTFVRQGASSSVHPSQRARHKEGGGRAAAFSGQAREFVYFACPHCGLITTGRTEPKFAGQEPGPATRGAELPVEVDRDALRRVSSAI